MQRKLGAVFSAVCGLSVLVVLLLALGSRAGQTRAAAPMDPLPMEAHSQQAATSGGACSRPLVVGLDNEPGLDFHRDVSANSLMVLSQLMEGLYRYGPDDTIQPAGALTHAVSADGLVYTVTLRSDARWSDGQPVTAQHYVDGIIRLLDPDTEAGLPYMMYAVEGAEDFNTGVITDPNVVGVDALSAYELKFTLEGPSAYFPSIMASFATYPARLDLINGDLDWTEAGHFVGNGPYALTQWVHYVQLVVEKNPQYHGASQVAIEEIHFLIMDQQAQLAAYEDDQLDVSAVPVGELPRVLTDSVLSSEFQRTPYPGIYYLGLNVQLTATNHISVRKALASAIDRGYLLTDVLNMPWREEATSVIPPGIPGYQNGEVGYTFDATQAQAYLAQTEYAGGAGLEIELWANTGNENIVDAVAQQWRDNLNITVTTFYTDYGPYLGLLDSCQGDPGACTYNAYRMGWIMDYGDANNILNDLFHPDAQRTGWDSARYRELVSMALTETNQVSRTAYYQEADRILVEDEVAVIPLFFYDRQSLVKSDLLPEYIPFYWGPFFMNWRLTTTATDTIPSTGGTISSPDGDVEIEFPEGAVPDTVAVTYTAFYASPHPPTGTFSFAGNAFILEVTEIASGNPITTFAKPLTITIYYTDGDLNGIDEDTLELMYWNGSAWVTDGITIVEHDKVNNRIVVTIAHLTQFALFGKPRYVYLPLVMRNF